jgi:hypothetical protein
VASRIWTRSCASIWIAPLTARTATSASVSLSLGHPIHLGPSRRSDVTACRCAVRSAKRPLSSSLRRSIDTSMAWRLCASLLQYCFVDLLQRCGALWSPQLGQEPAQPEALGPLDISTCYFAVKASDVSRHEARWGPDRARRPPHPRYRHVARSSASRQEDVLVPANEQSPSVSQAEPGRAAGCRVRRRARHRQHDAPIHRERLTSVRRSSARGRRAPRSARTPADDRSPVARQHVLCGGRRRRLWQAPATLRTRLSETPARIRLSERPGEPVCRKVCQSSTAA